MPTGEPPLRPGALLRRALSTYRHRWVLVAGLAFALFGPAAAIETVVGRWAGGVIEEGGPLDVLAAVVALVASGATAGVIVFYAGLLDHVVGEHHHGHDRQSVREIVRTLPYRRLIAADLLLVAGATAAAALLFLPSLVVFTLFALVGPVVNIERRHEHSVLDAFRRSAHLVRPHFWLILVLVTLPVYAEHAIAHGIDHAGWERPVAAAFLMNALVGITVGALVGLVEVVLAHELIARDPLRRLPARVAVRPED